MYSKVKLVTFVRCYYAQDLKIRWFLSLLRVKLGQYLRYVRFTRISPFPCSGKVKHLQSTSKEKSTFGNTFFMLPNDLSENQSSILSHTKRNFCLSIQWGIAPQVRRGMSSLVEEAHCDHQPQSPWPTTTGSLCECTKASRSALERNATYCRWLHPNWTFAGHLRRFRSTTCSPGRDRFADVNLLSEV